MSITSSRTAGRTAGRYVLATRPLLRWRTIDLVVVAFIGAVFGIAYWGWDIGYTAPSNALAALFPPLQGITSSLWLVAGVVGGLVVRRPGAALFAELLAATVSMLPGTQWGVEVFLSGLFQGLGAEIGFALVAYASFGIGTAVLAGALAAPIEVVYEWYAYWTDWDWPYKLAYLGVFTIAGGIVAGGVAVLVTRLLARTGAVDALPPGQELREQQLGG